MTTLLVWLIVMVVNVINVVVKTVLRKLSAMERAHDKTEEVLSSVLKMFVV